MNSSRRRCFRRVAVARGGLWCLSLLAVTAASGCGSALGTPRVIYLDGAGWFGSVGSVRAGLRQAGFKGAVETFTWTSFLGAPADHLLAARSRVRAKALARRIEALRRHSPRGKIYLLGLSSGTAVIARALKELPQGVQVDNVVLFSSSLSAGHNLAEALQHVRGRLYATCSTGDMLLASLALNADGTVGRAAGQRGFVLPAGLTDREKRQYTKVVNLPWRPAYAGAGWNGGHGWVTRSGFVRSVIAPRLLSDEAFPLDRPLVVIEERKRQDAAKPARQEVKEAGS